MGVWVHERNTLRIDSELFAGVKRFGGMSCLVAIVASHCVIAETQSSTGIPVETAWQLETGG